MRKVYLLLTLFITSFFFVSNVFAAEQIYEVPESQLSILSSDAFISLREAIIEHCNVNNKKYIIACSSSSTCMAAVYDPGKVIMSSANLTGTDTSFPTLNYVKYTGYKLSNGSLTTYQYVHYTNYFYTTANPVFTYVSFIDTNDETLTFIHNSKLVYNGFTYEVPAGTHFPSLYEFNESYSTPTDRFIVEREVISNFYSVILEKIVLLANYFINNFFLMLILGIFILIFIFEIIRRRII